MRTYGRLREKGEYSYSCAVRQQVAHLLPCDARLQRAVVPRFVVVAWLRSALAKGRKGWISRAWSARPLFIRNLRAYL